VVRHPGVLILGARQVFQFVDEAIIN
jgi:hypothetical protein